MELPHLALGISDIHVDFGENESFGFDAHGAGYPPSSAHSSSSASSSFGPYTPTSGRSTPHAGCDAVDFVSSFASSSSSDFGPYTPTSERSRSHESDFAMSSFSSSIDPFSFDLTPPSSALSAYFQIGSKDESAHDLFHAQIPTTPVRNTGLPGAKAESTFDMFQPRLPITPTRDQEMRYVSSSSYGTQLTPSQSMGCFYNPFSGELEPSPFPPTPIQTTQPGESWGTGSIWVQPDSPGRWPGDFSPATRIKQKAEVSTCLSLLSTQRKSAPKLKKETAAPDSPSIGRKRTRSSKNADTVVTKDGLVVSRTLPRKFRCQYHGCTRQYERKEHLKRHVQSNHEGQEFKCLYCPKIFNRSDNKVAHLKLHFSKRDSGRVNYVEGEVDLAEILGNTRCKRRKSTRKGE
ncbi:hypothetical protein QBC47DRAFT_356355 [Echria macrotheca]|uniref:C2H2-type domain-containing protein n=1 Tax=Echria macrotheca TaxID=438768 RepID=A0AAJ0BMX8_9PEZI|nr:hypothetical protein QBC47DRAFT_356355 [Echria macrotheca]